VTKRATCGLAWVFVSLAEGDAPPVRGGGSLPRGALVEIDAILFAG